MVIWFRSITRTPLKSDRHDRTQYLVLLLDAGVTTYDRPPPQKKKIAPAKNIDISTLT